MSSAFGVPFSRILAKATAATATPSFNFISNRIELGRLLTDQTTSKLLPPSSNREPSRSMSNNNEDGDIGAPPPRAPGRKPKRPMTAYNFFYRDEQRRIQEQQQQAATGGAAAAAASEISRNRHEDASLSSSATAAVNVLSSSSSSLGPCARSTEQSSSSTTSDSEKSGTTATGGSVVPAPLPRHLQSLQQAGTSDAAIAALVEHQSSFRDTSREIARRWQLVDIGEFDRYQRLAEQDAERYKRELAEYEAEGKRRKAVVRKVVEAEAAEADKQARAPFSNSVCTGKGAGSSKNMMGSNYPTPSVASDLSRSLLPWSNQYQPQRQAASSFKNTSGVSLPILATSPQRPPSNDNPMQLVISQLLQNQQWLLGAQRPSHGPIQATTSMPQRPAEGLANAQQGDSSSGQSKIIQMLIQQNQRLQMEVQHLRQSEETQRQIIQIQQLRKQQMSAHSSVNSISSSLSPPSRPGAKAVPNSDSRAKAKRSTKRPSRDVQSKKSPKTSDTARAPSKKKAKSTTKNTSKKAKEGRTPDSDVSVDEASKGLLSLRSRVSGSSDAGFSSLSTLTSVKPELSLETKDKKAEISDISTSASDAKKLSHESSSETSSGAKGTNTKSKGNPDISDISASGESDDNPKKRHRDEAASSEIPDVSSTGGSPSLGSSSPGGAGERNVAENAEKGAAPPTKKVRVVDPSPKRVTRRSASDSGELSSESSCGIEDSFNDHTTDASNTSDRMSALNESRAVILKAGRMYTSEMSSVSASGSENVSASGSDDDGKMQNGGRQETNTKNQANHN